MSNHEPHCKTSKWVSHSTILINCLRACALWNIPRWEINIEHIVASVQRKFSKGKLFVFANRALPVIKVDL